jgi:hypothetical protein
VFLELLRRRPAGNFSRRQLARGEHVGVVLVRMTRRVGLEKGRRRAQPEVQQLHGERAAVPLDRPRHVGEALELCVVPKPGKPEWRIDRVLVDQVAAEDDHSKAGPGALFVVGYGLLGENALMRAAHPCRTDGREHDPVRDRRVPDAQRREQVGVGPSVGHGRSLRCSFAPVKRRTRPLGTARESALVRRTRVRGRSRNSGMARAIRY